MDREDEVSTDAALARALVADQFDQWSGLPLTRVDAVSTGNDMYRLGDRLAPPPDGALDTPDVQPFG